MTALFEQSLFIFLDSLVLSLMQMLKESHDSMLKRHNNLE
jgi:D-arabinose 5-phosphate isomerase GutQ